MREANYKLQMTGTMVKVVRLELTTYGLKVRYSTN